MTNRSMSNRSSICELSASPKFQMWLWITCLRYFQLLCWLSQLFILFSPILTSFALSVVLSALSRKTGRSLLATHNLHINHLLLLRHCHLQRHRHLLLQWSVIFDFLHRFKHILGIAEISVRHFILAFSNRVLLIARVALWLAPSIIREPEIFFAASGNFNASLDLTIGDSVLALRVAKGCYTAAACCDVLESPGSDVLESHGNTLLEIIYLLHQHRASPAVSKRRVSVSGINFNLLIRPRWFHIRVY